MASVMVTTKPGWWPITTDADESWCVRALISKLPAMVADTLTDVDSSADITHDKVVVDRAQFDAMAKNNPDAWVVLTIATNELFVHAKEAIRNSLAAKISDFMKEHSAKGTMSIDVGFTDGTGVLLNEDGEVVSSW